MNTQFSRLGALATILLATITTLRAESPAASAATLIAADDARIAAMRQADRTALETAFSGDLRYAHSNGVVDTKASFLESLTSGKMKYLSYEHLEREFTFPAPGLALMTGKAHVRVEVAQGTTMDSVLGYLAVWKVEGGNWKLLAWQSCRLPVEGAKP